MFRSDSSCEITSSGEEDGTPTARGRQITGLVRSPGIKKKTIQGFLTSGNIFYNTYTFAELRIRLFDQIFKKKTISN